MTLRVRTDSWQCSAGKPKITVTFIFLYSVVDCKHEKSPCCSRSLVRAEEKVAELIMPVGCNELKKQGGLTFSWPTSEQIGHRHILVVERLKSFWCSLSTGGLDRLSR